MHLLKVLSSVFIFKLLEYLLAPFATVMLTKSLSVSDFGTYSFLMTICGFIFSFFTMGLAQYNYKIIPGRKIIEQYRILGNSLFVEISATIIGLIVIFFIFKEKTFGKYLSVFYLLKILLSVSNNELLRFLGYQKKNIAKAFIGFLDARLWLVFLSFFYFTNKVSIHNIFVAQFLGSVVVSLIFIYVLKSKLLLSHIQFKSDFIINILSKSIHFVVIDLGMYFLQMGSRYVLKVYTSTESIGYFSFAYSWISLIMKFGLLFLYIIQPYFSEAYYRFQNGEVDQLDKYQKYLKVAFKYSMYIISFTLVFFLINFNNLVVIIGKSEYLSTWNSILVLSVLPIFMFLSYFYQIIMLLTGNIKKLPLYYLVMAIVNIFLNLILVPKFDYFGAALASTLSYFLLFLIFFNSSDRNLSKVKESKREVLLFAITLIFYIFACNAIRLITEVFIIHIAFNVFVVFIIVAIVYLFSKEDFSFLKKVK